MTAVDRAALAAPAQSIRRLAAGLLADPAEVDDLVEEILGACVDGFPGCTSAASAEQWVMRVANRVVDERWRRRPATSLRAES